MSQLIDEPKPSRRQQQKDETRRIILDAAYDLFEEKGYHATTMRKLAAHANVGLGTIFKHFPDKSSLMAAALAEDFEAVIDDAMDSMPDTGITSQLAHVTRCLYQFYAKRPLLAQTLCKETMFLSGTGGEVMEILADSLLERISELIGLAVDRGELSAELDIPDATMAFWAFYFTGAARGIKTEGFDVDAQVEMVERLSIQYLRCP